ncbi:MAG TPA: ATP-grasp domain-containing protein [Pseudomonadales bacterium]|nr:ATP-grasp domain-containing protein [Pseudomonadales bacterium]
MHFLYPSDPLRTKKCDEFYAAECAAVQAAGFEASIFPLEDFQGGSFRPFPALPTNATIIYRGWMLSSTEYEALVLAITQVGACPLSDVKTYLSTHYLPNWYSLITEFTPETRIFPADADLGAELRALGWKGYFIKDYVKSLKTSVGSRISTPEQAVTVAAEMLQFRGKIEGGFCVRQVEDFLPQTEKRFFVLDSVPCSMNDEISGIVSECARRIKSRFFSVDIVQRADGKLRVVEIGDGQVSDIVGWTPECFAKNLAKCFSSKN